ncbi:hypothetical protein ACPPVU_00875 [Mucilaginibacter sp. McL0603]|uniref:hypothetical protein n=1 Tax=Mucilaginibacter sp. McL0603 TaxID=3415670 RepID=UPI003CF06CF1
METTKIIKGNTEQDVWSQIEQDLNIDEIEHYEVLIKQGNKDIEFIVDIDLGGGFEGGSQYAMLRSPVLVNSNFKFAIHNEGFIDEVGKFFGMQDVETGYEELDKHLVIKTNDENKVRRIFASDTVRNIFIALDSFHCGIHTHNDDGAQQHFLELYVDENVEDLLVLKSLYKAFYNLLIAIEQPD